MKVEPKPRPSLNALCSPRITHHEEGTACAGQKDLCRVQRLGVQCLGRGLGRGGDTGLMGFWNERFCMFSFGVRPSRGLYG